jgi:hypothetical protein
MELGIIGLGRMGANMTERLVLGGHRLISFDGYVEVRRRPLDSGRSDWRAGTVLMLSSSPALRRARKTRSRQSDRRAAQRIRRSRGEERLVAHGQR